MAKFVHSPIRRHEALVPFRRDHYVGLVQSQHMKQAADADGVARRKAVAEFADAWDLEIARHFDDEERLLADLAGEADRRRLLDEHQQIRALAAHVRGLRGQIDLEAALVRQIGEWLEKRIRWEGRELFVRLQQQLTEDQLDSLTQRTAPLEDRTAAQR